MESAQARIEWRRASGIRLVNTGVSPRAKLRAATLARAARLAANRPGAGSTTALAAALRASAASGSIGIRCLG